MLGGGATLPEAQPVRGGSAHTAPAWLPAPAWSRLPPGVPVPPDPGRGLSFHVSPFKCDRTGAPGSAFESSAASGVPSAAGRTAPAAGAQCVPGPGLAAAAQLAGV